MSCCYDFFFYQHQVAETKGGESNLKHLWFAQLVAEVIFRCLYLYFCDAEYFATSAIYVNRFTYLLNASILKNALLH